MTVERMTVGAPGSSLLSQVLLIVSAVQQRQSQTPGCCGPAPSSNGGVAQLAEHQTRDPMGSMTRV